jgi:quercetin dioxygenase-like cupin family protein
MKIERVPFTHVVWTAQPSIESRGEVGSAFSKTMSTGDVSVRMVEFSPGYRADHWCAKGHVVLLLEGLLTIVLEDGRSFQIAAGDSFQVGDDDGRHRAYTDIGAKVFIVD